jgi:drug/metabolite transporter (DMT)-like permease
MDWVLLSLLSAMAFTTFTIIQKRTLDRHVSSPVTFYAIAASMQIAVAVVVLAVSLPHWLQAGVAVKVVVGLLQSAVQLLQGYAIKREIDISRIVPVLDSFPLFVIVIAIVFLGESLTPLKWAAALMVISGGFLASWHQALPGERVRLNRSLVAILGAAAAMAVMTVLVKVASAEYHGDADHGAHVAVRSARLPGRGVARSCGQRHTRNVAIATRVAPHRRNASRHACGDDRWNHRHRHRPRIADVRDHGHAPRPLAPVGHIQRVRYPRCSTRQQGPRAHEQMGLRQPGHGWSRRDVHLGKFRSVHSKIQQRSSFDS